MCTRQARTAHPRRTVRGPAVHGEEAQAVSLERDLPGGRILDPFPAKAHVHWSGSLDQGIELTVGNSDADGVSWFNKLFRSDYRICSVTSYDRVSSSERAHGACAGEPS